MAHPLVSRRRASAISSALFFIGLAIVALTGTWWPGMLLVIGIPLALRQYLLGHTYDMFLSLVIFVGLFITAVYNVTWDILLPVLFGIAAVYIILREFQIGSEHPEDEDEEDINLEIEEEEAEEASKKPKRSR
jgi:hypothetical protein